MFSLNQRCKQSQHMTVMFAVKLNEFEVLATIDCLKLAIRNKSSCRRVKDISDSVASTKKTTALLLNYRQQNTSVSIILSL